jgi:PilZ domain
MARETNEGASYLMALKQSVQPPADSVSAPALSPQREPQAANAAAVDHKYQGLNQRRAPRYKCEGSAELRKEDSDVRTWATFTDISLHGCYVEAQATYPPGTTLHMKLEVNGIKVETTGNVRVNYPYLGMGIAFVDMSEEKKAHLRRMLATISHGCVVMGPGVVSNLPSTAAANASPLVTNPEAAIQQLLEFFESRQILMRDDFLKILRKSQTPQTTR